MEAIPAKGRDLQAPKYSLNLTLLEEKVVGLIDLVQSTRDENLMLKEKNKDLQAQLKALEVSLVSETKGLEELSQEKMMTQMAVDNLLHSINSMIELR